jgi:hypothetical protein
MTTSLAQLQSNPLYQFGSFHNTPVVIHDDDRWLLPVLLAAQQDKLLPQPALLVNFDQHEDAANLRKGLGLIPSVRENGYPKAEFIELVRNHLANNDDDWIKAGMELGLISDAVAYGVTQGHNTEPIYTDHLGGSDRLFLECELPGDALAHQGSLSDLACAQSLGNYWETIGWEHKGGRFGFREDLPRIILNIDLDCFAMYWRGYRFPWEEEVYNKEFHTASDRFSTKGLTGADFFRGLVKRAGVITIAREPTFTGGKEKGAVILRRVGDYLFGGELKLQELG